MASALYSSSSSSSCSCCSFPRFKRSNRRRTGNGSIGKIRAIYTEYGNFTFSCYTPPVINISNLLAGQAPTCCQIEQVQKECLETGFLAIRGGCDEQQLQQLFSAAEQFFDLPLDVKMQHVVGDMQQGRGYEISPEHQAYMQRFAELSSVQEVQAARSEPSAMVGILSERFLCGPVRSAHQSQCPYYSSELGQVFFAPDRFPDSLVPQLQPLMQQHFLQCEAAANAVLRLLAAALGIDHNFFADKVDKHHSNLQVANYPSQLRPPGPADLRKKAHVDSGTLTLLASQDWLAGSGWSVGDGGLQLLNAQGDWLEVQVPQGALLLNLGSLMTRWTNGLWKSTVHRVTNPLLHKAPNSRRLSMAFFHKPNYDATIEVLPTCYRHGDLRQIKQCLDTDVWCSSSSGSGSSSDSGGVSDSWLPAAAAPGPGVALELLPAGPLFEPATVGDLTRQGVLHRLRQQGLSSEEASKQYHHMLAAVRSTTPGGA